MTIRDDIMAEVARAIPDPSHRVPADPAMLAQMRRVARWDEQLEALYSITGDMSAEQFDLFEPALFVDVNSDRDSFGELADLSWFGADFGSGFFAIDVGDVVGLGNGAIVRADRGDLTADSLVPVANTLAEFLKALNAGDAVSQGPTLGQRAAKRLEASLNAMPSTIETGPPLDPIAFVEARARGVMVPMPLAALLRRANGLLLGEQRQIWPFERMHTVADGGAVAVGEDKKLGVVAVTLGDWQDLPADRLFAFKPGQPPESGQLLGRTADVITRWIEEAA